MAYPYFDLSSLILFVTIGIYEALLIKNSIKRNSNRTLYLGFSILIIFAVSRKISFYLGGMDSLSYEYIFLNILHDESRFETVEFVFLWFTKSIRYITDNPDIYRLFCYSLIAGSYFIFIKEYCPRRISVIPFILIVYPFLMSLNTMRSSMAISLILIGLTFLKSKRNVISLIFLLLSVFVHRMSIIYVPFYFFYILLRNLNFINHRNQLILFFSILISLSFILGNLLQQYILSFNILEDTDTFYLSKNKGKSIWAALAYVLPLILLLLFFIISVTKKVVDENKTLVLIIIYDIIVFPCSFILGMWRANEYMYIPRLTMWGILIYTFSHKYDRRFRIIINLFFFIAFLVWFIDRIDGTYEDSALMPYIIKWL